MIDAAIIEKLKREKESKRPFLELPLPVQQPVEDENREKDEDRKSGVIEISMT